LQIWCSEQAGFCSGVRRAVEMVLDLVREGEKVYTLGSLVHNEEVEKYLAAQGVEVVSSPQDVDKGNLVIRTHGEGPNIFEELADNTEVILHDATCPRVKKVQRLAGDLNEKGYRVYIWGKPEHPEVKAIIKWTGGKAEVIPSLQALKNKEIYDPAALISQTTQERDEFDRAKDLFKSKVEQAEVHDTLCPAVRELQEEALNMASRADLMIVIGSSTSSNTEKLVRLCIRRTPTYRISGAEELNYDMIKDANLVGVIAGASTPDWIIKEVMEKMEEIKQEEEKNYVADQEEPQDQEQAEMEPASETEEAESSEEVAPQPAPEDAAVEEEVVGEEAVEETSEDSDEEKEAEEEKEEEGMEDFFIPEEIKTFQGGEIATGTIVKVEDDGVMVDLGNKTEAILPGGEVFLREGETLADKFPPETQVEVLVVKVNDQEGEIVVSHRRLERQKLWDRLQEAMENEELLNGLVKEVVSAGLIVELGAGVNGFMPGSLVDVQYIPDFSKFLNQEVYFYVIEINRDKEKVILSRKKYIEEYNEKVKKETLEQLQEGEIIEGTVRRLTKFGAFVDVGSIDGLVHVSEISWGRVNHPKEVLNEGDSVKVKVLQVVPEEEKISLSMRQIEPDPWEQVTRKFKIGDIVNGKVTRLVDFGAFVEILSGVEGLTHVSQVADHHVNHPKEVLQEGDEVEVKILDLRPEDKRISLSIKEAQYQATVQNQTSTDGEDARNVKLGDVFGDLFDKEGEEE